MKGPLLIIIFYGTILIDMYAIVAWTNYPNHFTECIITTITGIAFSTIVIIASINHKKNIGKEKNDL